MPRPFTSAQLVLAVFLCKRAGSVECGRRPARARNRSRPARDPSSPPAARSAARPAVTAASAFKGSPRQVWAAASARASRTAARARAYRGYQSGDAKCYDCGEVYRCFVGSNQGQICGAGTPVGGSSGLDPLLPRAGAGVRADRLPPLPAAAADAPALVRRDRHAGAGLPPRGEAGLPRRVREHRSRLRCGRPSVGTAGGPDGHSARGLRAARFLLRPTAADAATACASARTQAGELWSDSNHKSIHHSATPPSPRRRSCRRSRRQSR